MLPLIPDAPHIQSPEGMTEDSLAYPEFLKVIAYLPPADVARIQAAFVFAAEAHQHQRRLSGEPYITHPLAVATRVAEWRMDADAVCSALLHDVIEDTEITKQDLAERFGEVVGDLVEGLSKLDKMEFASLQEAQAENFRRMLLAMARDLRVVLIKLADRSHNLKTMSAVPPEKRRRIARETLEIYAPIANRLGLIRLFREFQDTAFHLIHPRRAAVLTRAMQNAQRRQGEVLSRMLDSITHCLLESHVGAEVFGREKSIYSIYRKMVVKRLSFSQILDIYAFRVLVTDRPSCYLALGALHALYRPVPGKFKDYVALPKPNGYQSLHTTVIGPYGDPIEIQIRTHQMHQVAQDGVASHWLYKDAAHGAALEVDTQNWLKSLVETHTGDSSEFLENVKIDLFPGEVYVFSPKGQIYALPRGATAVDFAYAVHTDIGHACVAARINNELMPLRSELSNGDRVEIVIGAEPNPNPAWLAYVKTGRARERIRHFLKTVHHEASAQFGRQLLQQELSALGVEMSMLSQMAWDNLLRNTGGKTAEDIFSDIGLGRRVASVVARRLLARDDIEDNDIHSHSAILIRGTEGMAIQLAHCCYPIPGDPIVGSIRKGSGLIVHTQDCPTIQASRRTEPHKWLPADWDPADSALFEVSITMDAENTPGVLGKIAMVIANAGANIESVSMGEHPERHTTSLRFTVQVSHRDHLAKVLRSLHRLPQVTRVARVRHSRS